MNTYLNSTEVMAFAKNHGDELVRQADLVNGGYSMNDYPIKKRESSWLMGKYSGMSSSAASVLQTSLSNLAIILGLPWFEHGSP